MQVNLDEKLYKDVEKVLKKLQSRLEIVKKLNDTKVRWMNK
jgi:DNA replication initiation complex subunit (GINS family)